jgi:hypothetical protein
MKYFCLKKDILATLAYFNLFDYPLRKGEIFIFLGHNDNFPEFEQALASLLIESVVFKIGEFYSLYNNYLLAERRYKGNDKALRMLKKAEKAAGLISSFPFVKGVAVSGSLSKYFADENADIDFFIITNANRLWIARTLLHIFKKFTYLFNTQDNYCMNYFIDEAEPGILEKNIYTATEIATILPLRGRAIFDNFYTVNNWTKIFFPNKYRYFSSAKEINKTWITYIAEKIFNNAAGNLLDNYLMKLTSKSWNTKTKANKRNSKGMLMSMHAGKHFSKPNPDVFQKKLLQRYEKGLADIFNRYEVSARLKNKI